MSTKDSTRTFAKKSHADALVNQEELILEFTETICFAMASQNISRTELGKRLNKSKSFVSQLLNGERNMTLRTLADVLGALDAKLRIEIVDSKNDSRLKRETRPQEFLGLKESVQLAFKHVNYRFQNATSSELESNLAG